MSFTVSNTGQGSSRCAVSRERFGSTNEGEPVDLFVLTNARGVEARVSTYGGILTSLLVPDKNGERADVVLGFDRMEDYLAGHPYFGCITGRFANRIGGGTFTLDGTTHQLAQNEGDNHLHGGEVGFDKRVWAAREMTSDEGVGVELSYFSPDGEENYPGNLATTVTYFLGRRNELVVDYSAISDKPTPVNLTHHSYFNLAGEGAGDVLDHRVLINADRFVPVGEDLIPLGVLREVEGTPMDFRQSTPIGARIDERDTQLENGSGYDHSWALNHPGELSRLDVRVSEPESGRVMEIYTTEPAVQFYSGNYLDGSLTGKAGQAYGKHAGFALETQQFPDAPNQPDFPSTVLRPGEKYSHTTVHRFSPG